MIATITFLNWLHFGSFCPHPLEGDRSTEIYNLCPPCPKDASYQIWKELGKWAVFIKKKLKILNC
jgi:hypothetical protein